MYSTVSVFTTPAAGSPHQPLLTDTRQRGRKPPHSAFTYFLISDPAEKNGNADEAITWSTRSAQAALLRCGRSQVSIRGLHFPGQLRVSTHAAPLVCCSPASERVARLLSDVGLGSRATGLRGFDFSWHRASPNHHL